MKKTRNLKVKDLFQINRPTVGNNLSVALWRILRYPAIEALGTNEEKTYDAGKAVGRMIEADSLEAFVKTLNDLKVGVVKIVENSDKKIVVDVDECITCSGIAPPIGKPVCHFEAGLVAGFAETLLKKEVEAKEILCDGGMGDETCRMQILL